MKFVYPDFLYALTALAIPIIIHLFNFRRFKKVYFSNVAFLTSVKQESKSKSRLKELILLLIRLLAIACLILAFAQPYFPTKEQQQVHAQKAVSIYIDNSFSMEGQGELGLLLDMAKQYAYKIIEAYPPGQKFQLITASGNGDGHRAKTREQVEAQIGQLEAAPTKDQLVNIIERQNKWLGDRNQEVGEAYLISDFQRSTNRLESLTLDTAIQYHFLPLSQQEQTNLFIDSMWLSQPSVKIGQSVEIGYRLKNSGDAPINNVAVKLLLNDAQEGSANLNLAAQSGMNGVFKIASSAEGWNTGQIVVNDFPIEYDNDFYFSYFVIPGYRVAIINDQDTNANLSRVFRLEDKFQLDQLFVNQLVFQELYQYDAIVLQGLNTLGEGLIQELKLYTEAGGVLIMLPGKAVQLADYNRFLSVFNAGQIKAIDTTNMRCNLLNYEAALYQDVFDGKQERIDLPMAYDHLQIVQSADALHEPLLTFENGYQALYKVPVQKGFLYQWAMGIDGRQSNLSDHAQFLLATYKMVLSGGSRSNLYYELNSQLVIESQPFENPEQVTIKGEQLEFIPEIRPAGKQAQLFLHDQVSRAGYYQLNEGDTQRAVLALNYPRTESNRDFYSVENLEEWLTTTGHKNVVLLDQELESFGTALTQLAKGDTLWKTMLLLALLFLLTELAVIKLWRR